MLFTVIFGIAPLALGVLIIACMIRNRSAARRRAAAEQAAAEQAAADKRRKQEQERRAAQLKAEQEQAARRAAAARKKQEQEQKRQEREQRQADAHAVKVARAAELAELAERRLRAEKELAQLRTETTQRPQSIPEAPAQDAQAPAQAEQDETPADPSQDETPAQAEQETPGMSLDEFAAYVAPKPFAGETVAFTGTLPTMERAEAIKATQERGGRAYDRINTTCTLLVVGERAGMIQLDKADNWGIKKITWQEWFARAGISYRRRMIARSLIAEGRA